MPTGKGRDSRGQPDDPDLLVHSSCGAACVALLLMPVFLYVFLSLPGLPPAPLLPPFLPSLVSLVTLFESLVSMIQLQLEKCFTGNLKGLKLLPSHWQLLKAVQLEGCELLAAAVGKAPCHSGNS